MAAYARICRLIGESGAGQLAKMMNQICIAGLMQGLSEALAFGQKAGLDGEKVVEVISQGAAGSWQMVNRHKTMLADSFDFGFAVDWMRKDLGICLETRRPDRRTPAGDGARGPVLQGCSADGRGPKRHVQPDPAVEVARPTTAISKSWLKPTPLLLLGMIQCAILAGLIYLGSKGLNILVTRSSDTPTSVVG